MKLTNVSAGRLILGAIVVVTDLPLHAQRQPVEARRGMVASASSLASQVGVDVLQRGGNAVDAAVAVGLALAVTYPRAGNVGGGGFMTVALADGRTAIIDYRETAPAAATRNMYLGADGKVVPGLSLVGHKAAGVPGTVAGLALALEKYGSGKLTWAELVEPARRLATDGFPLPQGLLNDLRPDSKTLSRFAETKRVYLRDGKPWEKDDVFRQPDLGRTFERLQKHGPREFYEGETARLIAEEMAKNGGLITRDDLRGYRAVERRPLVGNYRGYEIVTMPPPSSGGVALLQMLAIFEPRDLKALGHASSAKTHLFVEAMRRAYRDRAEYLADPDFVEVPVAGLVDKDYARKLMDNFEEDKATPSKGLAPGKPKGLAASPSNPTAAAVRRESTETTHYSIVDEAGNAVANTYTLNGLFGNGVTVPGTGILLNNEMDDFSSAPGAANLFGLIQGEANAIAPGKRPLSSMNPTVVKKDGKVFLVTGSPGGATIINTVLLVVTGVIDYGMNVTQAVEQPRFHHQWMPDQITHEPAAFAEDVASTLKAKGHKLITRSLYGEEGRLAHYRLYWGDAESVLVEPVTGLRLGANDPRSPDSGAVGY